MKVFAFAVLALAVFGANADVVSDVTDAINAIIERIPEPLVDVHDRHYELSYSVEKISFDLNDLEIKGVNSAEIATMEYDESTNRLEYEVNIPTVDAYVDFSIIATGLVNFEHEPTIRVDLTNLKLTGYGVIDTEASPTQLTDFSVLISLEAGQVELTNILNDSELTETLTNVLNERLASAVNAIAVDLEPVISPIAQSFINIVLRHI